MASAVANALASFGAMSNWLPLSPARVCHLVAANGLLPDVTTLEARS